MGTTAKLTNEFIARDTKVLALSVDGVESHHEWIKDINETQKTAVNFPIIADEDRSIAELYDMIHPNASATLTVRSLFIIAPDKSVKLIITYPASTGRNFQEILRVLDSLQLTANYSVATPADWKHGEDVVVVPAIKTEDIPAKFPKGFTEVKPYLRLTPQPNI
ncbi:Alkyl hydroperoxide reductase subunit C [compost metagenome]